MHAVSSDIIKMKRTKNSMHELLIRPDKKNAIKKQRKNRIVPTEIDVYVHTVICLWL